MGTIIAFLGFITGTVGITLWLGPGGKKDARFRTGYKDNQRPLEGTPKGLLVLFAGILLVVIGIAID